MATYNEYIKYAYGVPVSFPILLAFMGMLFNYDSVYFVVDIVLGIGRVPKEKPKIANSLSTTDQQPSEKIDNTKKTYCKRFMSKFAYYVGICIPFQENRHENVSLYLHIERGEGMEFNKVRRISCCSTAIYILTILLTFIYESCILSNANIKVDEWCPDYEAECFDTQTKTLVFNCSPYKKINPLTNSNYLWCVGWIFHQMTIRKVLDAIGVCGGLLGIISCTIPWMHKLAYYENNPWKAVWWIWVASLPIGAINLVVGIPGWAAPSLLTILCLSMFSSLLSGAWGLAFKSALYQKRKVKPDTRTVEPQAAPQTTIPISDQCMVHDLFENCTMNRLNKSEEAKTITE